MRIVDTKTLHVYEFPKEYGGGELHYYPISPLKFQEKMADKMLDSIGVGEKTDSTPKIDSNNLMDMLKIILEDENCIVDWKGVYGEIGKKPLKFDRKLLYNFPLAVISDIINKIISGFAPQETVAKKKTSKAGGN